MGYLHKATSSAVILDYTHIVSVAAIYQPFVDSVIDLFETGALAVIVDFGVLQPFFVIGILSSP